MKAGMGVLVTVLATLPALDAAAQAPEATRGAGFTFAIQAPANHPDGLSLIAASPSDQEATQAPEDDRWSFAGTAKWGTLAISAGAAAFGFSLNGQADDMFARVEEACLEDPDRCADRNPDGSFSDEELESLYQDTLAKDRQARAALLVSQVALAASVVFFIVDLTDRSPPNVPYDPPVTMEVGPRADGAFVLGARLRLGRLGL